MSRFCCIWKVVQKWITFTVLF